MRIAKACGATRLIIYGDSNLVVQQTIKDCEAVADNMSAYQKLYGILEGELDGCELNYIARTSNTEAEELVNIGSTRGPVLPGVFLESINQRSIKIRGTEQSTNSEADATAKPEQVTAANQSSTNGDNDMVVDEDNE